MNKIILVALFSIFLAGVSTAELKKYPETDGRTYHSMVYEAGCNGCHSDNTGKVVTDAACKDCHGAVNGIEIPEMNLAIPKANPHKSVHYGNAVSCLACHSEHKQKAALCADCHRTWFKPM